MWRRPANAEGGGESRIIGSVLSLGYAVVDQGVYFIDDDSGASSLKAVRFLDFADGNTTTIAEIGGMMPAAGFTVSPDERNILYCLHDAQYDLMLVENFR